MGKVATARSGVFTYEDFCALTPDGQKADLIDGVIYVASPENIDASELGFWLAGLFYNYAARQNLGKVYHSRGACRLDNTNAPEPDVTFVSRRHRSRLTRGGVRGSPDMALEVVSPDSVERDYVKKFKQYERFKIPEYWIVDEAERKVHLHRLDSEGHYPPIRPRKGRLYSRAVAGFWLDSNWVWQDPLPDMIETVLTILGKD